MRRLDLAMIIGLAVSVLMSNIAAFGQECDLVRSNVVRLHIMANSNSIADQKIKLQVRDRILADVGGVFTEPQNQQDAKKAAEQALPDIVEAAEKELRENGVHASVKAELTRMYFTTREYGDISLPAGIYDAVRVTIGSGEGKNWWCVIYPPICVAPAMAPQSEALEEIKLLNNEPLFKPKLAIVELFEQMKEKSLPKRQAPGKVS